MAISSASSTAGKRYLDNMVLAAPLILGTFEIAFTPEAGDLAAADPLLHGALFVGRARDADADRGRHGLGGALGLGLQRGGEHAGLSSTFAGLAVTVPFFTYFAHALSRAATGERSGVFVQLGVAMFLFFLVTFLPRLWLMRKRREKYREIVARRRGARL